jgi:hypothetical protein
MSSNVLHRPRSKANVLTAEEHRTLVDAAKKRAVAQGCNYAAFRQLVLGAHLKPMQRSWMRELNAPRDVHASYTGFHSISNTRARGEEDHSSSEDDEERVLREVNHSVPTPLTAPSSPTTCDDFMRAWRRLGRDDNTIKLQIMYGIPPERFADVFKVSIGVLAMERD